MRTLLAACVLVLFSSRDIVGTDLRADLPACFHADAGRHLLRSDAELPGRTQDDCVL